MTHYAPTTSREVFRFNFLPATYAHPSWYDATEGTQTKLQQLRSAVAQHTLSQWLLQRYGLRECTDFDFGPETGEKSLCLREPQWLHRLALLIGVLRRRENLLHRIGDDTWRRLAQQLGQQTVREALAVWPLPPIVAEPEECSADTLIPSLFESGVRWLFGWLEPFGSAVTGRTRFKFAHALAQQETVVVEDTSREATRDYLQSFIMPVMMSCH
jgi:hypothetical protein